jgi:hypothetical protein
MSSGIIFDDLGAMATGGLGYFGTKGSIERPPSRFDPASEAEKGPKRAPRLRGVPIVPPRSPSCFRRRSLSTLWRIDITADIVKGGGRALRTPTEEIEVPSIRFNSLAIAAFNLGSPPRGLGLGIIADTPELEPGSLGGACEASAKMDDPG